MDQDLKNCPTEDELTMILSGDLSSARIINHVEGCRICQNELDRLSNPDYLTDIQSSVQKAHRISDFLQPHNDPALLGQVDNISIESQIGSGGMGIVFRGKDQKLGRRVAVKFLKRGSSFESNQRFLREAKAVAMLTHPNLLPVYSTGNAADGRPFLVMPFVEGNSLKERIEILLPTPRQTAEMTRQIALGLQHAHEHGLAHRDIKPANILLEADGQTAKLADFGLVRSESDDTLTALDVICGTPEYMSPESGSREADLQSGDIYGLGIVLYECLTGTTPFRGQPLDVLQQHRTSEPLSPRALNREIPLDLETICLKSISKAPAQRYASALELADDLKRFLNNRAILAKPEGAFTKANRWVRRNFPIAVTVGLATILLSAAAGISTWFWLKSEKNASLAEERLASFTKINETLRENQNELSDALRNSPAVRLTEFNFAYELPTGVRNQLLTEISETWRLLFDRALNDLPELRTMAEQLTEITDMATGLGMQARVIELTSLSRDVANRIISMEEASPQDYLLAARIFEQHSEGLKRSNPVLSAESLEFAESLVESIVSSDLTEELIDEAKLRLTSINRLDAARAPREEAKRQLLQLQSTLNSWESHDPKSETGQHWLEQHEKLLLALAKVTEPTEAIDFRINRSKVFNLLKNEMDLFSTERNLIERKLSVNRVFIAAKQMQLGKSEQAETNLRSAISSLEALVEIYPQNTQYRADVFETQVMLAGLCLREDRKEEAFKIYSSALGIHRVTARLNPSDPTVHQRLAAVLETFARLRSDGEPTVELADGLYEAGRLRLKTVPFILERASQTSKAASLFEEAFEAYKGLSNPRSNEVKAALQRLTDSQTD